jgi:uncharacterized protein (DUF983 family)
MNDTAPGAGRGPSVLAASLWGRCPRCGKGSLFRGYLKLSPSCSACGLDFTRFEAGDGPAVFVILIVGAIVAGGALITEVTFQPPYWVHALIWGPALLILSLGLLRPLKAALIVLQYKHKAEEGRRLN